MQEKSDRVVVLSNTEGSMLLIDDIDAFDQAVLSEKAKLDAFVPDEFGQKIINGMLERQNNRKKSKEYERDTLILKIQVDLKALQDDMNKLIHLCFGGNHIKDALE